MSASAYVTPDGTEVHLRLLPPRDGRNRFAAVVDGVDEFEGSWDEVAYWCGERDWKHVSTATAQKRLAARGAGEDTAISEVTIEDLTTYGPLRS